MDPEPLNLLSNKLVGKHKSEMETPCLCLDLDRFEANLEQVAAAVRTAGKNWRPHANCHKSVEIGKRILRCGAIGLTCAKVSEAATFAAAGLDNLLIAHLPVGTGRVRRIAELCHIARPIVTCDHYVQAETLSTECLRQSVTCRVLVDINVGMDRTGVRPGRDTRELAQGIERLRGLKLTGIMGYEGRVMRLTDVKEKRKNIDAALGILLEARDWFQKTGHCCEIVSAGGTGSLKQVLGSEVLTEVQAGGAIFGDPFYCKMPDVEGLDPALTLLSTVVSRPAFDRAVLDAGRKAITAVYHPPQVQDWPDATIQKHNADHIVLELGPNSRELRIGDQVELIVGYADMTTMLHENYLCFRDNRLEDVWMTDTRGKMI